MTNADQPDYTVLTVQLLSAYVTNNMVPSADLAGLIQSTRAALVAQTTTAQAEPVPEYTPAVTVRKSLASREHLISLIDGRPYKMLKRHLASHGLTPAQYRERYGLASTYPMVATGYSEQRREVAQRLGLGQRGTAAKAAAASAAHTPPATSEPTKASRKEKTAAYQPVAKPARKAPSKTSVSVTSTDTVAPPVDTAKASKPAKAKGQSSGTAKKTPAEPTPKASRPAKAVKSPRKTLGIKTPDAQATPEIAEG